VLSITWHEVDFYSPGFAYAQSFCVVLWEGNEAYKGRANSSDAALTIWLSTLWSTTCQPLGRHAKCMRGWLFQSGLESDLP
jgi:hypothetical protein